MNHFKMLDSLLKETSIKIEYVFYLLILFKNRPERIFYNFENKLSQIKFLGGDLPT
jgi:hypothetical protein